MKTKTFEIRDRGTFIPALAVSLRPGNVADRYLLARAGYGETSSEQKDYVLLMQVAGGSGTVTCDPHDWGVSVRTMHVAHQHILDHWDELSSGDVVDVEFILGETDAPKTSEAGT